MIFKIDGGLVEWPLAQGSLRLRDTHDEHAWPLQRVFCLEALLLSALAEAPPREVRGGALAIGTPVSACVFVKWELIASSL
jgi:hypothetical protein